LDISKRRTTVELFPFPTASYCLGVSNFKCALQIIYSSKGFEQETL
jgi:hypothetical protein